MIKIVETAFSIADKIASNVERNPELQHDVVVLQTTLKQMRDKIQEQSEEISKLKKELKR